MFLLLLLLRVQNLHWPCNTTVAAKQQMSKWPVHYMFRFPLSRRDVVYIPICTELNKHTELFCCNGILRTAVLCVQLAGS